MHNVEIKLELRDPGLARGIVSRLGARRVETLRQTDTYFRLADGRLKKREYTSDLAGAKPTVEWIFYHRDNQARQRLSHFRIYSESEARAYFGLTEPPTWVVVKKVREVWMGGPEQSVRVHLDDVEGLGAFIEFEALVTPRLNLAKAHAAVEELRRALAPALGEPVSVSYSDMLAGDLDRGGEVRMLPGPAAG